MGAIPRGQAGFYPVIFYYPPKKWEGTCPPRPPCSAVPVLGGTISEGFMLPQKTLKIRCPRLCGNCIFPIYLPYNICHIILLSICLYTIALLRWMYLYNCISEVIPTVQITLFLLVRNSQKCSSEFPLLSKFLQLSTTKSNTAEFGTL